MTERTIEHVLNEKKTECIKPVNGQAGIHSPVSYSYNFSCLKLTSLYTYAPLARPHNFDIQLNKLETLQFGPESVSGFFDCNSNMLTSLKFAPVSTGAQFNCSRNLLTSLEFAPRKVLSNFWCTANKLTTLKDIHKQIDFIGGGFYSSQNPIESHVLGLLLIKGITEIFLDNMQVEEILNSHLGKGRVGMLMAQEELIEAGLEEFAQL